MKKINPFIISLFLLIGCVGCEKDISIDYINVDVVYQRCSNSADNTIDGEISKNDILLFNLAIIDESEIIKQYSQNEWIEYIIYDPNSATSNLFTYKKFKNNNQAYESGSFCNFPVERIETIEIPKNGLYISFSGDYVVTKLTLDAMFTTYDISIKTLKIQVP